MQTTLKKGDKLKQSSDTKLKQSSDTKLKQSSDTKLDQTKRKQKTVTQTEKQSKDDSSKHPQDDKLKKGPYTISTPRNYIQKSSTADIYGQRKSSAAQPKAPKKPPNTSYLNSHRSASPMKGVLNSSPSSSSLISSSREGKSKMAARKNDTKAMSYTATPRNRESSVTVNSPKAKRKLDLEREKSFVKEAVVDNRLKQGDTQRQRTKTRTLDEAEVKILTPDVVDNNAEMLNLTKRLSAKPKAFYVDLGGEKNKKTPPPKPTKEPSDDEVSYEDDFESYESDFDSYHSSPGEEDDDKSDDLVGDEKGDCMGTGGAKEARDDVKDDEKMLDSGNFDLRDQRSAKSKPTVMDFIQEASEDKKTSFTDEGFQDMSSSSAVSSMKTEHVEVLYRPLFIDFSKSKENKRKKKINKRLKQRAKDLLSIITLHEMSYSLFEMKPISYDMYMATFGRANYTQVAVQTFDDGITEEVQTDDIECQQRWTQHPVEYSKSDICFSNNMDLRKYSKNTEDYLSKFTFLTKQKTDVEVNNMINLDENYKTNRLRIYLEQKDGAGSSEMLPYETYKCKLKNKDYDIQRLGKFLKRMESRVSNILNINKGNSDLTDLVKTSKLPFSKGYLSVSTKNVNDDKLLFLKNTKISLVCFSKTKTNILMTVHKKIQKVTCRSCTICLWDLSVAKNEPLKVLTAIDNVTIGRLRGASDGHFIAALEDGSIHLWDLTEEPTCRDNVASDGKTNILLEENSENLAMVEKDEREIHCALQACAYTSSAHNMSNGLSSDKVVGLDLTSDLRTTQDSGRRFIGQVVSLLRTGIIAVWSIVQEKFRVGPPDIGKAYWSKMKLERNQTFSLLDYLDIPINLSQNGDFNLNAAKRRLTNRKQEKSTLKLSRPKSAISSDFEFDIDRPNSAASTISKRVLPTENNLAEAWESGIVCYDLKIVSWKNADCYLIAKNCGEVLCSMKYLGAVKVKRFSVAADMSSVTCIEVSPHGLPYFLAATDSGTVHLYSLLDNRVLLTLDCRNVPSQEVDRCQSDEKGRFISSGTSRANSTVDTRLGATLSVTSLSWPRVNPCRLFVSLRGGPVVGWDLMRSDIYAERVCAESTLLTLASDTGLALLTTDGEVQIHRLASESETEYLQIFEKYVALL